MGEYIYFEIIREQTYLSLMSKAVPVISIKIIWEKIIWDSTHFYGIVNSYYWKVLIDFGFMVLETIIFNFWKDWGAESSGIIACKAKSLFIQLITKKVFW